MMPMPEKTMTAKAVKSKILVVDDHPVFREGLVRVLNQEKDMHVVGEAATATEALKSLSTLHPHMAIIDISLESSNGIELARTLRARLPAIRLLILSVHNETLYAERALRAGANGYVMKKASSEQLVEAVRTVLAGQTYVSSALRELMFKKLSNPAELHAASPLELLSDREVEVFQFIGRGYGTRQIADELHLSMKTVESHREHIRKKLRLENTFELVQHAISWAQAEY
jgi:DNA-binding NarL/FixJ family response regulator